MHRRCWSLFLLLGLASLCLCKAAQRPAEALEDDDDDDDNAFRRWWTTHFDDDDDADKKPLMRRVHEKLFVRRVEQHVDNAHSLHTWDIDATGDTAGPTSQEVSTAATEQVLAAAAAQKPALEASQQVAAIPNTKMASSRSVVNHRDAASSNTVFSGRRLSDFVQRDADESDNAKLKMRRQKRHLKDALDDKENAATKKEKAAATKGASAAKLGVEARLEQVECTSSIARFMPGTLKCFTSSTYEHRLTTLLSQCSNYWVEGKCMSFAEALEKLQEDGHTDVWLHGGVVRDLQHGLPVKDIDVKFVLHSRQQVEELCKQEGWPCPVIWPGHHHKGIYVKFTPDSDNMGGLEGQTMYQQLPAEMENDVNALHYDLKTKEIIDPLGTGVESNAAWQFRIPTMSFDTWFEYAHTHVVRLFEMFQKGYKLHPSQEWALKEWYHDNTMKLTASAYGDTPISLTAWVLLKTIRGDIFDYTSGELLKKGPHVEKLSEVLVAIKGFDETLYDALVQDLQKYDAKLGVEVPPEQEVSANTERSVENNFSALLQHSSRQHFTAASGETKSSHKENNKLVGTKQEELLADMSAGALALAGRTLVAGLAIVAAVAAGSWYLWYKRRQNQPSQAPGRMRAMLQDPGSISSRESDPFSAKAKNDYR